MEEVSGVLGTQIGISNNLFMYLFNRNGLFIDNWTVNDGWLYIFCLSGKVLNCRLVYLCQAKVRHPSSMLATAYLYTITQLK